MKNVRNNVRRQAHGQMSTMIHWVKLVLELLVVTHMILEIYSWTYRHDQAGPAAKEKVMTKYVISDLRRYTGTTEALVHSVNNHVAAEVPGALIYWIARPNQSPTLPTDRVVHIGEPDDIHAANRAAEWIAHIAANGYANEFVVLSFDPDFRHAVARSAQDSVAITVQHLGSVLQAKPPVTWPSANVTGPRPGTIITPRPVPSGGITDYEVDQAIASMLHELGHLSPQTPLLESQVREQLVMRDPRMAKVPGDAASQSLIQRWRLRNTSRGYIGRVPAADRANTWGVYLSETGRRKYGLMAAPIPKERPALQMATPAPPLVPVAPRTAPTVPEQKPQVTVAASGVTPLDRQLVELTRHEKIGVMPESADWIWSAIEQLITQQNKEWTVPVLLREAVRIAEPAAIEKGYVNEKRWDVAKRCLERLMLVAGAFLDQNGTPIPCGPGSKSAIVKELAKDYRMRCWAYTVEFVIEKRQKVDYDEIICALGLLLFRSSQRRELDVLENRADEVIEYLKHNGRIVEDRMGTQTILQRPRVPALLKLHQSASA